jgi:hypothetical protein
VVEFREKVVESVTLTMELEMGIAEELYDEVIVGALGNAGVPSALVGYTRPVLSKKGAVSSSNIGPVSERERLHQQTLSSISNRGLHLFTEGRDMGNIQADCWASAAAAKPTTARTNFIFVFLGEVLNQVL